MIGPFIRPKRAYGLDLVIANLSPPDRRYGPDRVCRILDVGFLSSAFRSRPGSRKNIFFATHLIR